MNKLTKYNADGRYVKIRQQPNGDISLALTSDGKDLVAEMLDDEKLEDTILGEVLEDITCNSPYGLYSSAQVGGLTESPIIGWEVEIGEKGEVVENDDTIYWWFPDYMVINIAEALRDTKCIIFTAAK